MNILDEAIKIPPKDRVQLAELILASIDYEDDNLRKIWLAEVKDRMESVENGKSTLLDFNQHYAED